MKKRSYFILASLVGVSALAAVTLAQTAPQWRRERPSPETMQRMQDGRIAMITTALKLTEAQQKLWAPVEAKIRENQAERAKRMQTMGEQRQPGAARPELPERMERMSQMMADRAERSKAFLAVFKPFHASLTEEQKKVMEPLMAQLDGGRRGGHHRGRWAMHHGPGPNPQ
jgi:hypothetical protein